MGSWSIIEQVLTVNQLKKETSGYVISVPLFGDIWIKIAKKHLFETLKGVKFNATIQKRFENANARTVAYVNFKKIDLNT